MHKHASVTPTQNDLLRPHVVIPCNELSLSKQLESLPCSVDFIRTALNRSSLRCVQDGSKRLLKVEKLVFLQLFVIVDVLKLKQLLNSQNPGPCVVLIVLKATSPCDLVLVFLHSQSANGIDEIMPELKECFKLPL